MVPRLVYYSLLPVDEAPDATEGYVRKIVVNPRFSSRNVPQIHSEFLLDNNNLGMVFPDPSTNIVIVTAPSTQHSLFLPSVVYNLSLCADPLAMQVLTPLSTVYIHQKSTISKTTLEYQRLLDYPFLRKDAFVPAVFGNLKALKIVRVCSFVYMLSQLVAQVDDSFWTSVYEWVVATGGCDFASFAERMYKDSYESDRMDPLFVFLENNSTAIEAKFIQFIPQLIVKEGFVGGLAVVGEETFGGTVTKTLPDLYPYLKREFLYCSLRVVEHNSLQLIDVWSKLFPPKNSGIDCSYVNNNNPVNTDNNNYNSDPINPSSTITDTTDSSGNNSSNNIDNNSNNSNNTSNAPTNAFQRNVSFYRLNPSFSWYAHAQKSNNNNMTESEAITQFCKTRRLAPITHRRVISK